MNYPFKAVLFDWAYTLVDLMEEDDRQALVSLFAFLREKEIELPAFDEFYRVYREMFYGLIALSRKTCQEARFENVFNSLLLRYSIELDGRTTERDLLTRYYQELYASRRVYPDALSTLKSLKELGLPIGIVSNTTNPGFMKDYERVQSGLDSYVDFSIYSSEVPYRKPHPSIFETCLARLGLPACDVLFVGDDLDRDVAGAQGVGMPAVWINRNAEEPRDGIVPDFEIQQLSDLLQIHSLKA